MKISDEQFLSILRESAGIFGRTAREISKKFKIKYTRQSVRERAENFLNELTDIREENLDIAEEGLHSLMQSKNENIKLRALEIFLKTQGKKRGYNEKQEVDVTTRGDKIGSQESGRPIIISVEGIPKSLRKEYGGNTNLLRHTQMNFFSL